MKKHLSLFVTTSAAALALAYVFFIFFPGQKEITELRGALQKKQQYVAESAKLVAVVNDLERELDDCHSFIDAWRAESPSGSKLSDLMSQITSQAAEADVQLVSFHPAAAEQHELLRELPATIRVDGSFLGISDFLRRLESLPAAIWIPTVNLKPEGEDGQNLQCELTLSIFSDTTDIAD